VSFVWAESRKCFGWVPCCRTGNRKGLTIVRTQTVAWYYQLITGNSLKMLPWGSHRDWNTIICRQILRDSNVQTAMNDHAMFTIVGTLRYIEPVKSVQLCVVVKHVQIHLMDDWFPTSNDSSWRTGKRCVIQSFASWRHLATRLALQAHHRRQLVLWRLQCHQPVLSNSLCRLSVRDSRRRSPPMLGCRWCRAAVSASNNNYIMTVSCTSFALLFTIYFYIVWSYLLG